MDTNARVLVTGATGFIGTRLVQMLSERGNFVRALSRRASPPLPPGFDWADGGPFSHPNIELAFGDITDRESLARAAEGCRYVFHLAAYAKNWAADPKTFYRMNVEGMRNVFDAAESAGVERLVWTSSCVTLGPTRRGEIGTEDMPRSTDQFFTEYEETKTIAEKEAIDRARGGLPVVIVNPTRVYGPGQLTEGNSVALLIDQYDRGRVPFLLNRGVNIANWVFVDDVARGHILAMEKGRVGERYVLGGENASLKAFFRTVDRVSGKRHFQVPIFRPGAITFAWLQKKRAEWFGVYPLITPGWVRSYLVETVYSTEKAERELEYRPTPMEAGVRVTYDWLLRVRQQAK